MNKISKVAFGFTAAIPIVFLAIFFLWPVGSMLIRGISGGLAASGGSAHTGVLSGGTEVGFAALRDVFSQVRTWRIIWQTLWMALAGTFFSVLVGVPGAYVLYRLKIPAAALWRGLVSVPFILPTVVVGIAFRVVFDHDSPLGFLHLEESSAAVVMAMVFFNFSLIVRTVGAMWASIDPRQVQAARTLGASSWYAFRTVTLVQLAPAIAAGASLVFLYCSTAYGLVTTLGRPGYGTIETEIYIQTATFLNLDKAAMLSLVQFVLVLAALVLSSRLTARTESSLRSVSFAPQPARLSDIPALFVSLCMLIFLLTPMLTLVVRSFQIDGHWSVLNYYLLASTGEGFSGGASVLEALRHSVVIAADATVISLAIGLPLSYVLSRHLRGAWGKIQKVIDGFVLLPLGVSTVTVGFGMLITLGVGPMADSAWLVPLAQAVVALPLVVRAIVPQARSVDPHMREAGATLGASPIRVLFTLDLPLASRGIMLAVGFAFSTSIGEFGATSFLSRPDFQTLPVLIVKLLSRPGEHNYGMALAGAVILALVAGLVMMFAEILFASMQRIQDKRL